MFSVSVTNDGKYLINNIRKDCDDLCLTSYAEVSDKPIDGKIEFKPLISEWLGGFSYIHNIGSKFYFKTNYKAAKSKLILINLDNINKENWVDVIQEHE